jgi:TPR repeat protein
MAAFVLVVGLSTIARAGPMEDADEAWKRGDYASAAQMYRSLAEQGKSGAQHALAKMYENGEGVQQNNVEALRWYRLAADHGHAGAQLYLGGLYATGAGVPRDYVQAYVWFSLSLAAGQGEYAAQGVRNMEEKLTPAQLSEAQRRVRQWRPN